MDFAGVAPKVGEFWISEAPNGRGSFPINLLFLL
jgi:hypothetical protein